MKERIVSIKYAFRFLSVFLICIAAVFVVGLGNIEASAAAGDTFTVDGIQYTINDDEASVNLTGYYSSTYQNPISPDLVIPSVVLYGTNSYNVIGIEDRALYCCSFITSVTIPDSVTFIGNYAFTECKNLTNVTIPDSVISLGSGAFESCTSLTNAVIPDSITKIEDITFGYCYSLTSVTIPDSVTKIVHNAFYSCSSLENITIPDSVTSIGENAFYAVSDNFKINGYTGSYAEEYAAENDISFIPIDDELIITIPSNVTVTRNGIVLANGTTVSKGDVVTITAVPPENHNLKSLTVNGVDFTSGDTYTVGIVEGVVIAVEFEENSQDDSETDTDTGYTVTIPSNVTVTRNGSALSSGAIVSKGDVLTITAVPPQHTTLKSLTVNGTDFTSGDKYTVGDENVVIAVEFDDYVENPDTGKEESDTIYVNEGEQYTATSKDKDKSFVVNGGKLTLGEYNISSLTVNSGEAYGGTGSIESVTINGGSFTSKGKINGNVLVTGSSGFLGLGAGGTYNANGGTEIMGSLTIQERGVFNMNGGNVRVYRNFTFASKHNQENALLGGTLWIGGNFTQYNKPFKPYGENFKVIFYTKANKTVTYEDVVINNLWITKEADNGTNLNRIFYMKNVPNGIYQCDNNCTKTTKNRCEYIIDFEETMAFDKELAENLDRLYDSYGSVSSDDIFLLNGITIKEPYAEEISRQVAAWNAIVASDCAKKTDKYVDCCAIKFEDVPIKDGFLDRKVDITFSFVNFMEPINRWWPVKPPTDGISFDGIHYLIEYPNGRTARGQYSMKASTDQRKFASAVVDTIKEGVKSDVEAAFKRIGAPVSKLSKMTTNQFVQFIFEVYDGYKTVEQTVNKYKSQVELFTPIYITKYEMEINCPVDAYVYDENDVLVASVVNNEVVLDNDEIVIWVEDESKHIGFNDNGYTVRIVGNGVGTMDYFMKIRDDLFNVMQTAGYYDLPVTPNCEYEYEAGDINASELVDTNKNVITPDAFEENEKSATNGHTLTHNPYKAPTFAMNGNIEYWYCQDCNMSFIDAVGYTEAGSVIIPALSPSLTVPSYSTQITTSSLTTTVTEKTTEASEAEDKEDNYNESDKEEKIEIDENTDTTKPVEDVDNDDSISSENDDKSDADNVVSEEDDANPGTGVVFCFGGVLASAMAVMIAGKRKNK